MVMFHKCIFSHDLACGTMYISRRNWLNCGSDVRLTWKKLGNLDVLHGCPLPVMDRAMAPGYIGIDDISGIYPRATNWGLLNQRFFHQVGSKMLHILPRWPWPQLVVLPWQLQWLLAFQGPPAEPAQVEKGAPF